jgi:hypothetical protein
MSAVEVGLIRYSTIALEHIGEVRNPRVGELPSRTPNLPVKTSPTVDSLFVLPNPLAVASTFLPLCVLQGALRHKALGSEEEYETDTDEDEQKNGGTAQSLEDSAAKETQEMSVLEDDSFLGAIKEGASVLQETILAPLMPFGGHRGADSTDQAYAQLDAPGGAGSKASVGAAPDGKRRRKRRPSRDPPLPVDPQRPLGALELEQGRRLGEGTPLSLRRRAYEALYERDSAISLYGGVTRRQPFPLPHQ